MALSIGSARAAELPAPARTEIESLLTMLGNSQCQFYRNGSWHDGREAESHLRMKFEYLLGRGALHTAEDFIDEAATKSSLSGESYAVKCSNDSPLPSATWLKARLQERRTLRTETKS
jgi:hypothetical protein